MGTDDNTIADAIESNVGRIVAFVLTPILLPVAGALAYWLQNKLGIDMDPAVAVGYVVSVVTGLGIAAAVWLRNRGKFETAVVESIVTPAVNQTNAITLPPYSSALDLSSVSPPVSPDRPQE